MISNSFGITREEGKRIIEAAKEKLRNSIISKQISGTSCGNVVKRQLFQEQTFVSQAEESVSLTSSKGGSWKVSQSDYCVPSTSRQCPSSYKPVTIETISSSDSDDECEAVVVHVVNSSSSKQKSVSHPSLKDSSLGESSKKPNKSSNDVEHICWRQFCTHLLEIQNNVKLWGLFIPQDIAVFNAFVGLSSEAQKLYVQLLNSDYSWRRVSSLKYAEIGDRLHPVLHILLATQFLSSDISGEETISLLDLLTLSEIKSLCQSFYLRVDGRKETLAKSLIDFCNNKEVASEINGKDVKSVARERIISHLGLVVKLTKEPRQLFMRTMLLYSLPHCRTMKPDGRIPLLCAMSRISEKKIAFPGYSLKPLQNFFASRESLLRFQDALELEAIIKGKLTCKHYDEVIELHNIALSNFIAVLENDEIRNEVSKTPLYLRNFTAGTVLVHAILSCMDCLKTKKMYYVMIHTYQVLLEQDVYFTSCHGLCYDQLAMIYHRYIKDVPKAVDFLIEAMTDSTLTPIDRVRLSNRGLLITKRKRKRKADNDRNAILTSMLILVKEPPKITLQARCFRGKIGKESAMNYIYETEEGIGQIMSSVEEIVLLHHRQLGFDQGIRAENVIGTSIFGIFFWDIIYSVDVPNVFVSPFQNQPLDLKSGEFYKNREELIKKRLEEIEDLWSLDEMEYHVRNIWIEERRKESIVSWKSFESLKQFEDILDCMNRQIIAKICSKMAKEFPVSHKGFPPIFIWNQATRKCKFIKVVGPHDQISPFEKSWFAFLDTAGADVAVCYVKTTGDKSQKRKNEVADNTDALDLIS